MTDVIIIGAGTAGLTAGIYAARAGKDVLILEAKMYGGQIVNSPKVENYPGIKSISGYEFAMSLYEQTMESGAKLEFKSVTGIRDVGDYREVICGEEVFKCKNIIIATGASYRHLGLAREEELVGRGVSYCATCDGNFYKGRTVAVNGGGNTALSDAEYLAKICEKVYVIHRRDTFRADSVLVERVKKHANVELVMNTTVKSLLGDETLEGIEIENTVTGEAKKLSIDGLFVAIGQVPATEAFSNVLSLDKAGYIVADEGLRTNMKGVFVAGDVRTKAIRQLATAAGDGAVAASILD